MTPIMRAIECLTPQTKARLAEVCNQRPQEITRWVKRGQPPARYCLAIENATDGLVTRYDLRPDVFGQAPSAEKAA